MAEAGRSDTEWITAPTRKLFLPLCTWVGHDVAWRGMVWAWRGVAWVHRWRGHVGRGGAWARGGQVSSASASVKPAPGPPGQLQVPTFQQIHKLEVEWDAILPGEDVDSAAGRGQQVQVELQAHAGPHRGRQMPSRTQPTAAGALALCPPTQARPPTFWNFLFSWCCHEDQKPGICSCGKDCEDTRKLTRSHPVGGWL